MLFWGFFRPKNRENSGFVLPELVVESGEQDMCIIEGAIKKIRAFKATFFVNIELKKCTSKSILPNPICLHIS